MERSPPLFSVIVRCFNRHDRVVQAVNSILAQTEQDFEVIVVDDASTDGSAAQIRSEFDNADAVRLVIHDQNQGAAAAANTGVAESRGQFIAFLDSDDTYLPTCLAAHRQALKAAPNAVMTYCDYVQVWEPYGFERILACGTDDQDQRLATLKGGFIHSQSLIVVRREAFDAVGTFDTSLQISHDFDLWMRLALTFDQPFLHIEEPLVRYTLSADGVTKRYDRWWQEAKTVVARGRAHPNARPYLFDLEGVDKKLGANILARQALEHWVRQRKDQPVSVIVPMQTQIEDLVPAFSSVWEQTYREFEIVLVGTEDQRGAMDYWASEARAQGYVPIVVSAALSLGDLLVRGMKVARGPLIAFLEAGYSWHPDYLSEQVRAHSFPSQPPAFSCVDPNENSTGIDPLPGSWSNMMIGSEMVAQIALDETSADMSANWLAEACYAKLDLENVSEGLVGPPLKIARDLVSRCAPIQAPPGAERTV